MLYRLAPDGITLPTEFFPAQETMTMVPSWVRHPKLETFLRVALIFSVVVEGHGLVPNSAACRTRITPTHPARFILWNIVVWAWSTRMSARKWSNQLYAALPVVYTWLNSGPDVEAGHIVIRRSTLLKRHVLPIFLQPRYISIIGVQRVYIHLIVIARGLFTWVISLNYNITPFPSISIWYVLANFVTKTKIRFSVVVCICANPASQVQSSLRTYVRSGKSWFFSQK